MSIVETDTAANTNDTSTPSTELKTETPGSADDAKIEVVSVTEEDFPTRETPNTLIVSPLGSFTADVPPEKDPEQPAELHHPTAASPVMPVTKVQPFIHGEDLGNGWKNRVFAHRFELLIASCFTLLMFLALGIGLGVGLSCTRKFRCGSSAQCVTASAQCDGNVDCKNQEDELGCVRLSGRSSVLQVQKRGEWRTVCSEEWNNQLGISACKQLGYSRYLESVFIYQTSIEEDLQTKLISINYSQSEAIKLQNAAAFSKSQCSSGMVTSLKCIDCGSRPDYNTRIVGGNSAKAGQFPWQVSLLFQGQHICGGSIITSSWILTAAHCVYGFTNSSMWTVLVGITEQPIHTAGAVAVKSILLHTQYRPKRLGYDIALMRLVEPLAFDDLVQPICLPNDGEEFNEDTMCWISGWGATEEDEESSVVLRSAMIPLIPTKTCNQPEVYDGLISSWMICAGYLEGGVDTCQGDSGGPLACEVSSVWKLVGATSWGIGCGVRNKPGVYTHIMKALSWIRLQMEREEAWSLSAKTTSQ